MVRIPTMDNYGVLGVNTQQAYSNAQASPQAFGAGVGVATQNLGAEIGQTANVAAKIKSELSTLAVEDKYNNEASIAFRDLDKEYTQMMGKNAIDGYEGVQKRLEETKTRTLDGIVDPQEKMMMANLLNKRIQQSQEYHARHLERQLGVYKEDTFKGSVAMAAQGAIDFSNDDKLADQYVRTGLHQFEVYGLENGKPREWVMQQQRKFTDAVYSQTIALKAQEDPIKAMEYLDKHGSKLSPEIMGKARKTLEPYFDNLQVQSAIEQAKTGQYREGAAQGIYGASFTVKKPTVKPPEEIARIIDQTADAMGIPPEIARAVASAESSFNPSAVSPAGAVGLFQLMPEAAKEMGISPEERTDPIKNARAGLGYLAKMMNRNGNNLALAFAAYNAGPGAVDKAKAKAGKGASTAEILDALPEKTKQETIPYVQKILGGLEGGAVTQATQAIAYPPKTEADLTKWYEGAISRVGNVVNADKIMSGLTAEYSRQKEIIRQKRDGVNTTLLSKAQEMKVRGVFDLNSMLLDPEVAEAWREADPATREKIFSYDAEEKRAIKSRQEETAKQATTQSKEASERLLVATRMRMQDDPDYAKNVNPMDIKGLTADDALKVLNYKKEYTKERDEQKANDPLFQNQKQGLNVFDEMYEEIVQTAVTTDTKINRDYLYLKGLTNETIRQAQAQNGGKPISAEEQRKIAVSVLGKTRKKDSGYFDFRLDTEEKSAGLRVRDLQKKFPNAKPADLLKAVNMAYENNQTYSLEELSARLKGQGF